MKRGYLSLLGYEHSYYWTGFPEHSDAVVALHGYGNSGRSFRYLVPDLNAQNIALFAPDLLGFGQSAKPEGGYSLVQYARLTVAFVDQMHLKTPWLMGHSFGGIVALATAIMFPKVFKGIILVSPGGFHPLTRFQVLADRRWAYKLMRSQLFKNALHASPLGTVFDQDATYQTLLKMYGSHQYLDLDKTGMRKKIANLPLPILLCWGTEDKILPRFVWKRAQKQVPQARFVLIPKAGHALMKDQPKELVHHISSFIAENNL
ncbi:MAG: alpha/beta hydrolase [Bacteroidetes Order II. Incertae sedis bacterium]|nr:alpha/beta hydrolase [Bacteroidetes Order II. bacterium]